MAKRKPQTEYEVVQAQINERKLELKRNGFPEQMYDLWSTLRMYPGWAANGFETPLHPLAANLSVTSTALVSFAFNGLRFGIKFVASPPSDDRVFGKLTIWFENDEVMSSTFVAAYGPYGTEKSSYSDSSLFKKQTWVEYLARFQRENAAMRADSKRRNLESPSNLTALREQFGIPPPTFEQQVKSQRTFWRRLFSR